MATLVDVTSEVKRVVRGMQPSALAAADVADVASAVHAEIGGSGTLWAMARVPVIRRKLAEHHALSYSTVCAFCKSEAPETVVTVTPRISSSS